jgi:glycosyltransferase involved in cell wall biosynthesis
MAGVAVLIAITRVRDEADVIGWTIAHLLAEGVDHIVAMDNASEDDTRSILEGFDRVTVLDDPVHEHAQGQRTSELAQLAWGMGAEWVLPFDADELFYARSGTLAEWFAACDLDVVGAQVFDHIVTDDDDPTEPNPYLRVRHRRQYPQRMAKVAFRSSPHAVVAEGNHDVAGVGEARGTGLFARHVQYRSFEQMARKVRNGAEAMDAAGMHPLHGTHWRDAARLDDDGLFREWRRLCEEPGLIEDPAPWRA